MPAIHKTEIQHNTPAQVEEYVRQTLAIRDAVELTEDEWVALAPSILGLVASKQIMYEQMQVPPVMAIPRGRNHH